MEYFKCLRSIIFFSIERSWIYITGSRFWTVFQVFQLTSVDFNPLWSGQDSVVPVLWQSIRRVYYFRYSGYVILILHDFPLSREKCHFRNRVIITLGFKIQHNRWIILSYFIIQVSSSHDNRDLKRLKIIKNSFTFQQQINSHIKIPVYYNYNNWDNLQW